MIIRSLIALSAFVIASPALAQALEKASDRTGAKVSGTGKSSLTLDFRLAPLLGRSLPLDDEEKTIDDSQFTVSATFTQNVKGAVNFKVTPEISWAPNLLDDDDYESGASLQFRVEGEDVLPAYYFGEARTGPLDSVTPYAQYKVSRGYARLFGTPASTEHSLAAGVTYKNYLYVVCSAPPAADRMPCPAKTGWGYKLTGEVETIFSPDDSREVLQPSAKLALISPPFGRLLFETSIDGRASLFMSKRAPSGEKQENYRLRVNAGVNLKNYFENTSLEGLDVFVGGRFQKGWSNDPGSRYTRGYFMPTIALSMKLF